MVQYRKISDVSPGLILFQRHFFEAYHGGGVGGILRQRKGVSK